MRIRLFVRGRIGQSPEAELVQRYIKRVPWDVVITEWPDVGGPGFPPADGHVRTILLDETHTLITPSVGHGRIAEGDGWLGAWSMNIPTTSGPASRRRQCRGISSATTS